MANGSDKDGATTISVKDLPALDSEISLIMKTEFGISFWLSVVYFIFILSVPILNWTAPALMRTRVWGGMSLTWFLTAIVAMVLAVVFAALHVKIYQNKFGSEVDHSNTGRGKGAAH